MKTRLNQVTLLHAPIVCFLSWCPLVSVALLADSSHPISITQCDVFVNKSKTVMRLKAFAEDLEMIQGIAPYEDGFYDSEELRQGVVDHGNFLLERIELVNARGERLTGKVIETDPFEIPEEGIMSGTLMQYSMGWTIEYDYDEAPEYLTITQDIVDDNFLFPSELQLLLKQSGSDTPFSAIVKPGTPETIRFDWELPPLPREATGEQWQDWFEEQRQKTLGITSYSSVYAFVYITPVEVRQEVLIPLANLASMIQFEQADPSYLEIEEQDAAIAKIQEFFSEGNPVEIDGQIVAPRFDRVDFYGLDLRDFAMQAERRRVNMANGRVGVIMSYRSKRIPDSVALTWDKFSNSLMNVDAIVFALDKIEKTKFSKFLTENTFHWKNPGVPPLPEVVEVSHELELERMKLGVPLWSAGCLGLLALVQLTLLYQKKWIALWGTIALLLVIGSIVMFPLQRSIELPNAAFAPISPDDARPIFKELHTNLFRAFDYYEENDVYDALAASTDGAMLRDVYLKMRESLAVKEQGGAIARIDDVQIVECRVSPHGAKRDDVQPPGFAYRCKWNLVGTIEHWGHLHQRTNVYDVVFNVEKIEGAWKFTDFETLDEKQGPVVTSLRKF